ncbi:maleate cis-trans isomerase family protein [Roseovarius arcticus]|uniref:maleate cis-trans isomerase family protein n=1 Tax=Roseovarius arcticus TaxID=2547404 RepID=UPI0011104A21|nr:aspartate/glutamate racemase family protein [Roseovarius arcticus]
MLVPSSNTVLEPYTSAMFAPFGEAASVHFNRFRVVEISDSNASRGQFELETILEAAERLAEARPHCIAWCGTAASWLGLEKDRTLCRAITDRTGVPATSAMLAYEAYFSHFEIRRLAFVTPYLEEVQAIIIANFEAQGYQITAERHLKDRGNFSYGCYSPERVASLIREVAPSRPEAIAVICTNFRGAAVAAALEKDLGIPVLDSVALTAAHAMRVAGLNPALVLNWGRVFKDVAAMNLD